LWRNAFKIWSDICNVFENSQKIRHISFLKWRMRFLATKTGGGGLLKLFCIEIYQYLFLFTHLPK
jgi:hypothetical protein